MNLPRSLEHFERELFEQVGFRLDDRALILICLMELKNVSQQLDTLTSDVASNGTVEQSAVTLLQGLKTELDAAIAAQANGDDGAALTSLSTSLEAQTAALAAAVTANTPAAPATPGAPSATAGSPA